MDVYTHLWEILVTKQVWEHEGGYGSIIWSHLCNLELQVVRNMNITLIRMVCSSSMWLLEGKVWCWAVTASNHCMAELLTWLHNCDRLSLHIYPANCSHYLHYKLLSLFRSKSPFYRPMQLMPLSLWCICKRCQGQYLRKFWVQALELYCIWWAPDPKSCSGSACTHVASSHCPWANSRLEKQLSGKSARVLHQYIFSEWYYCDLACLNLLQQLRNPCSHMLLFGANSRLEKRFFWKAARVWDVYSKPNKRGLAFTCICSNSSGTLAATSPQATPSFTPVSLRASMTVLFSMSLGPSSNLMGTPCRDLIHYNNTLSN